ncbi:MAG TPA: hypothetical protein VI977_02540 [archaeon]|nr:hypothetical protein [archaeon]
MVKKLNGLFQCEECGMLYRKKSIAEKCEAWCKKYNSCNLEIIGFAVKKPK